MGEGWREFLAAWEDFQIDVDGYRELDDERVLVLTRHRGRGKTSGVELGPLLSKGSALFHVCGGKVTKLVFYWDRERAFADLGLAE